MSTKTLPAGTLKLILPDSAAAKSNVARAANGSARFKPLWRVFEVNDAGEIVADYFAADFAPRDLAIQYDPRCLREQYPKAGRAIRAAKWLNGLWLETRGELELSGVASDSTARA